MTLLVHRTGLVTAMAEFSTGQWTEIGQSMDATDIREIPYHHNVPGDKNGGNQGPPIEVQYLGSTVRISMELSRFNNSAIDTLRKFAALANQGTIDQPAVGALLLQSAALRIYLDAQFSPLPLNFPCCIVREPVSFNAGTKFSAMRIEFEAHRHPVTNVLYNSSGPPVSTTTTTTGA